MALRIFLFMFFLTNLMSAQVSGPAQFLKYDLDQGHINHVFRDSEGFIWVSTQDGISQYDGSNWRQYSHDIEDTTSLSNNYVWLSFEDRSKRLWIGTFSGGLDRFDKEKRVFRNFKISHPMLNYEQSNTIRCLTQFSDTQMVVGTDDGLFIFNLQEMEFEMDSAFIAEQRSHGLIHFHYMEQLDASSILVGGENGSFLVDLESKKITTLKVEGAAGKSLQSVFKINDGYVISFSEGILILDQQLNLVSTHILGESLLVTDIVECDPKILLIATAQGLFTLDLIHHQLNSYAGDIGLSRGLGDRIIFSICEIEKDLFWLGAKTGIFEFSTVPNQFMHIHPEKLCGESVLGMTEDDDDNLWIATRNGLSRISNFHSNHKEWEYYCYNRENTPALKHDYILNVMFVDGALWLGYRRFGLSKFELSDDDQIRFLEIPPAIEALSGPFSVSVIKKIRENELWIATAGNGVLQWDITSDSVVHFMPYEQDSSSLSHSFVFDIERISDSEIAFATANGGLCILDEKTFRFRSFQHRSGDRKTISNNFVLDIHNDYQGRIWVCTAGGLNLYHGDGNFSSWTTKDGLPNDVIYGMKSTDSDYWVSTNKGIVKIDITKNGDLTFKTFNIQDGVQGNEHNQYAHYQSQKGQFLFGGKNGISLFDPSKIKANTVEARPVISDFYLFNENAESFLAKAINYSESITLNYNQNFLSFDLAALSYRNPQSNSFKYRMRGLNENWIDLGTRKYISFNGLTPGSYILEIMAANNDGIWNEEIKTLQINILKPVWKRWYAMLFYALIFFGALYFIYRYRLETIRKIQIAKEEERVKIRERSARDFHDEAGSYITKLSLISEMGRRSKEDSEQLEKLFDRLDQNVESLRIGMKDFIWVIDPSNDSLYNTFTHIKSYALDAVELRSITLEMSPLELKYKEIDVNSEQRRQLFLIIKETISNSIKHSECTRIKIEVIADDAVIVVSIMDDGKGFNKEAVAQNAYGLKNIINRAAKIKAQVKIESIPGNGTSINLEMPRNKF